MSKQQEETDLVPTEVKETHLMLGASGPAEVIQAASNIASQLSAIIEERGLFTNVRGRKHVHVEGWTTLGAMIGVTPVEKYCNRLEDGSYEAYVELRTMNGQTVGGASAVCGMDEDNWVDKPEYARRSMAITRATGKAFRSSFSWIVVLAGYAPTPAEEMTGIVDGEAFPAPPRRKSRKVKGTKFTGQPLPDDQVNARAAQLRKRLEGKGEKISINDFWEFAKNARIDDAFANDVRQAHTKGKTTDWAAALTELLDEWDRYASKKDKE